MFWYVSFKSIFLGFLLFETKYMYFGLICLSSVRFLVVGWIYCNDIEDFCALVSYSVVGIRLNRMRLCP